MIIIYDSNTGYTKKYAEMLSKEIECKLYNVKELNSVNLKNEKIIYLGWLMANFIHGKNIVKNKNVIAYCCVGMKPKAEINLNEIAELNKIQIDNLFYLRGGVDLSKLKGFKKFIMRVVMKKRLKEKNKGLTKFELKEKLNTPMNYVKKENLKKVINFIK